MCLSQLSFPHQGKPEPPPDTMTENGQTQTITAEQRVSLFLLDFFFTYVDKFLNSCSSQAVDFLLYGNTRSKSTQISH